MALVTWASLSSVEPDDDFDFFVGIPHFDKLVHFGFYFGATVLGALFFNEKFRGKYAMLKGLAYVVVASIFYGMLIEVLQYTLTTDREGDAVDALANSVGALMGALATKWLFSRVSWLKWY